VTPEPRVVHIFRKNRSEEVRASLATYRGHPVADLRVWSFDDASGEVRPTRKGVCVRVEHLPRLLDAITALQAASHELTLLDGTPDATGGERAA
jgi:Transcriptional Coactivator p15 (PC4)